MPIRRSSLKSPGGPPLSDQRALYIELMANGMSNSAACKLVGINRRTGTRWRCGRTVINSAGNPRVYKPIIDSVDIGGRFLSEAERLLIADGLLAGLGVRAIATKLGRSPSTVSREIVRNGEPSSGRYLPYRAQQRAVARRARPKDTKLAVNDDLRVFVQEHLDLRWSPEQIAGALATAPHADPTMRIVHETIYQALYTPGNGQLRRIAAKVLRTGRSRRKRQRRADRRTARFVEPMTMIDERPADVETRDTTGHLEGDLLMGKKNRSAIATLVDRCTRVVTLVHLPGNHSAEQVSTALIAVLNAMPAELRRTLTWDQGSEMACHADVSRATGTPIFFCDPASPWQRGSNENTNGLLRQYFPKGTDLSVHTPGHLLAVATELNHRPRKVLGWITPAARQDALNQTSS